MNIGLLIVAIGLGALGVYGLWKREDDIRHYRRSPYAWLWKYSVQMAICSFLLFMYILWPGQNPTLVKTFREHPQNLNIDIGGAISRVFNSQEGQQILAQIKEQLQQPPVESDAATEVVAEAPTAAPASEPTPAPAPPSGGSVQLPADCGQLIKQENGEVDVYRCDMMDIQIPKSVFAGADERAELIAKTVQAYKKDIEKSHRTFNTRFLVRYTAGGDCGGVTNSATDTNADFCTRGIDYGILIIAHEMGHALSIQIFPNYRTTELWLSEGYATWLASDYWFGGQSPKDFIRNVYGTMRYNMRDTVSAKDIGYNFSAAFVDFLVEKYGIEKFYELYNSNTGDGIQYEAVTGRSYEQLHEDFYAWLGV